MTLSSTRTRPVPGASAFTNRASAFTLIELLVVIAIIAILAAILFPVFAKARDKARQATCQSNMKQIGLGILQYAQDADETLPPASFKNGSFVTGWDLMSAAYMGSGVRRGGTPGIFLCPNDDVARAGANESPRTYALTEGRNGVVNNTTEIAPDGTQMRLSTPLPRIEAPADTLMMAEFPNASNRFGQSESAFVQRPRAPEGGNTRAQNCTVGQGTCVPSDIRNSIHNNGWNYLFCDGHVKWLTPEKTISTPGVNYSTSITLSNGSNCDGTWRFPCGMWTVDARD